MNLYILFDKQLGSQLLYGSNMKCLEFQNLTKTLAKEYGDDIFILKEILINQYGFKDVTIQCVHTTKQ